MSNEVVTQNIYQRINKVMQVVKYVQKDKAVSGGGQNYKAVTHDQVVSVARQSLVDSGVLIVPSQVSGEFLTMRDVNATPNPIKMGLYTGTYEVNFINIDNPDDKITVTVQAHAQDNGDKAPGKAITYATKTAILKVLSLETGENDEARSESPDSPITAAQGNVILNVFNRNETMMNEFLLKHGYSSLNEIQKADYKPAVSAAKLYKEQIQ